jgi:putative oxygen-independent coproporphyrinogen III oxidase
MLAGVYLHIPFCKSRCSYCDFATGLYESDLASRYVDALIQEIELTQFRSERVDTIYFGGGTPSMLQPEQIGRIIEAVNNTFDIAGAAEITMEINPGSVCRETLGKFRKLGVNRASFGAQTFDDGELARLGRSHSTADTLTTFDALRDAGFDNVSFDLIAGLPGQTMARWKDNVARSLELKPEHLSFYLLEVHSGTPLAQHIERGIQPKPDEDLASEMYEHMLDEAYSAGYEHYEISNLAQPGHESKHNTKYWTRTAYFGFGCSAHSFDGRRLRWSNERDVSKYVKSIEQETSPIIEKHELNKEETRAEAVFLGMRLMRGVDLRHYQEMFGVNLVEEHQSDFDRFKEAGLIEFDGDVIRLTRAGALMSNEVFASFV